MRGYVVAGIGTEVGKTVVSAIMVEKFRADYWKPVQAGDLGSTDTEQVRQLAAFGGVMHPEAWRLEKPVSPHTAAASDDVRISHTSLTLPRISKILVVELAGGLMVPLNCDSGHELSNIDLLKTWNLPVVLVANYYLGSINHTLLSVDALRTRDIALAGLVFNGKAMKGSRSAILKLTGLPVLLALPWGSRLDKPFISKQAARLELT